MSKDSLGDRMKIFEDVNRARLPIRLPVIVRIDGCHFHSYTRGLKPFDENLIHCMNETAKYLCNNIQGAKLAFVQSDEISLLITNDKERDTQSWFQNNIQKMVSVSAALASSYFTLISDKIFGKQKLATFDSRCFVLPKEEVNNYFYWRQSDWTRNSVQMLARSLYSHKQLHAKSNPELQELCFQKGTNWNNLPTYQKRGRCVLKKIANKIFKNQKTGEEVSFERGEWVIDNEIPIFIEDKKYIESLLERNKI